MLTISRSFMMVYNAALGCVFALGIVGNLLVLAVVLTQKAAHTVINVYLVNLAVADILHLMSVPPLIHLSLVGSWPWGEAACTVYYLLYYINWTVSVFIIVAMGFDRYKAVVSPFSSERYRSHRFAAGLLVILWLLSALIMTPVGLCSHLHAVYSDELNVTVNFCVHSSAEENGSLASGSQLRRFFLKTEHFSRYLFVVGCLLPALLLAGFYGLILRKLYRLRQARAASSGGAGGSSGGAGGSGGGAAARFQRVTLLVTAVVLFYLACSLPHWVHVNLVLSMDEPASWMAQTSHLTTLLSYLGSAGNPVLYAFLNDSFRTGLGGLLAQAGCSDGGGGGGAGNSGSAGFGVLGGRRNRGAGGGGNAGRGRGGEIFALRSATVRAAVTDPATSRRETEPLTATAATAATGAAAGAADDDCLSDGLRVCVGMETNVPVLETAID